MIVRVRKTRARNDYVCGLSNLPIKKGETYYTLFQVIGKKECRCVWSTKVCKEAYDFIWEWYHNDSSLADEAIDDVKYRELKSIR